MRRVSCALAVAALAGPAAGCGGEEAAPADASGDSKAFVAEVDEVCRMTADAAQDGPRFPYRTFDPTNPDGRQRAVGRFYERLDTEGTLEQLRERLRAVDPPAELRAMFERLLADLDGLAAAVRDQTEAAVSGDRARLIEASTEVERAFEVLGDSAADLNTFECALSLERWPKALR